MATTVQDGLGGERDELGAVAGGSSRSDLGSVSVDAQLAEPLTVEEQRAVVAEIVGQLSDLRGEVWARRRRDMLRWCDQLEFRIESDIRYYQRLSPHWRR